MRRRRANRTYTSTGSTGVNGLPSSTEIAIYGNFPCNPFIRYVMAKSIVKKLVYPYVRLMSGFPAG